MFSPSPDRAQEPVVLAPNRGFILSFKSELTGSAVPPKYGDNHTRRRAWGAKEIRWRATGPVMVALNYDLHPGPPTKYFESTEGEFGINNAIQCVSFSTDARNQTIKLFLEIS